MLRISGPFENDTTATLQVEGRIVGVGVDLLERASLPATTDGFHVMIDLRDLSFVVDAGTLMARHPPR